MIKEEIEYANNINADNVIFTYYLITGREAVMMEICI